MRQFSEAESATTHENRIASLLLFLFGCAVLAFFVSVDRVDWLRIRPVTGSASAMAQAVAHDLDIAEDRAEQSHAGSGDATP